MRHLVLECFFYAWTNLSEFGERIGRDSVYTANRSHRFSFFRRSIISSSLSMSIFNLVILPFFRPRMTPSAFRKARASLVLIDIRFRSISATRPNAKQRTLLFMVLSNAYPSLVE